SPPISAKFRALEDLGGLSDSESEGSIVSLPTIPNVPGGNCDFTSRESIVRVPSASSKPVKLIFDNGESNKATNSPLLRQPSPSISDADFKKSILRSLETIKYRQLQHEEALEALKASIPHLISKQHTPCQVARIKLPFEEVADFEGMETSAAEDPTLKDEL
ncbi:unnamed protein product, partial [Allacma fusca]